MIETIERITAGAIADGIDADLVFQHLDDADLAAYQRDHLDDLRNPAFAQAVARAVRNAALAGRCTCDRCRGRLRERA